MSRLAGQRRALDRIEKALTEDDRQLWTMYALFTLLTRHDDMPATERASAPPWRLRRRLTLATAMALAILGLLTLSLLIPGRQACPTGAGVTAARTQSLRAGPRASCPARQSARPGHQAAGAPGRRVP